MSETASVLAETGCSVTVSVSAHVDPRCSGYGRNWKIRFRWTSSDHVRCVVTRGGTDFTACSCWCRCWYCAPVTPSSVSAWWATGYRRPLNCDTLPSAISSASPQSCIHCSQLRSVYSEYLCVFSAHPLIRQSCHFSIPPQISLFLFRLTCLVIHTQAP